MSFPGNSPVLHTRVSRGHKNLSHNSCVSSQPVDRLATSSSGHIGGYIDGGDRMDIGYHPQCRWQHPGPQTIFPSNRLLSPDRATSRTKWDALAVLCPARSERTSWPPRQRMVVYPSLIKAIDVMENRPRSGVLPFTFLTVYAVLKSAVISLSSDMSATS